MADELELKPENDEAQWLGQLEAQNERGYARGHAKGWADAIESLKVLNLTDAAEKLEALNNGQLVPVAD